MNGFDEHWPDLLLAAFLAFIGWILRRDITSMDKRHERAENKFEKVDECISDHETRITVLEKTEGR